MPGAVVSISSHVARGYVGNRAMVFALERLGFTVWAVPTIVLPHHPGLGPVERIVPEDDRFAALLDDLLRGGRAKDVVAVVSGYFASPGQVRAVAAFVETVKRERPDALYLCDPVIGDRGGLYVAEPVAAAIRDALLPLADAATPNAFECAWLAGGATGETAAEFAVLTSRLPPPVVLVTSVPALMRGQVGNLLTGAGEPVLFEHPTVKSNAKGTGDLLVALLLARRLMGNDWERAAELAIASVSEVMSATARAGAEELLLAGMQDALVQPRASVNRRTIGAAGHR